MIDNSRAISLVLFSIYNADKNSDLREMDYHSHKTLEISYVVQGSLFVEYYDSKKNYKCATINKNEFIIIKPDTLHKTSVSIGLSSLGIELSCKQNIVNHLSNSTYTNQFPNFASIISSFKDILFFRDTQNIFDEFIRLKSYSNTTMDCFTSNLLDLSLKKILVKILMCEPPYQHIEGNNIYINKAIQFIKKNFNRKLTTKIVSNHLQISPEYFQQIFLASTGKKFNYFVNEIRINYAISCIENTNLSLTKIAFNSGYASLQSFITNFKKIKGINPSEYKNKIASKQFRYFNIDLSDYY